MKTRITNKSKALMRSRGEGQLPPGYIRHQKELQAGIRRGPGRLSPRKSGIFRTALSLLAPQEEQMPVVQPAPKQTTMAIPLLLGLGGIILAFIILSKTK